MLEGDVQRRLDEIRSQRSQGLLSQQEAYEQHMALIASFANPQPVAAPLSAPSTSTPLPSPVAPPVLAPAILGLTRPPLPEAPAQTYSTPSFRLQIFAILIALLGGA